MAFARILALLDIILFTLGGGVAVRALQETRSPRDLDGLWKIAKAYTREADGRWREELGSRKTFLEFRGGASCARYRVTPEFVCERYDPYTLQGSVLAAGGNAPNSRYRVERRRSQLDVTTETRQGTAWRETRREIYVRVMGKN